MLFDVVIWNGRVIDGTGNQWFKTDIGIVGSKISEIGDLSSCAAKEVDINADGLVVSPGFIDMHSHGDISLLIDSPSKPKMMQGVTTEVIGNCGFSAAPIKESKSKLVKTFLSSIFPWAFEISFDWSSMREYLDRLERDKIGVNVAPLVGHGTIRVNVMGYDKRLPTRNDLVEMKFLLSEALADGAFGMSSGLIYPPGSWAGTNELVELCEIVRKFDAIYATHIRGEEKHTLVTGVKEALEIGFKSGVPVQISHHKAAGRDNWGNVHITLSMIDRAQSEGLDVTCDVYPYVAGSTSLIVLLPESVQEGGVEKVIWRLKNTETRKKIREINQEQSILKINGPENIIIASHNKEHDLEGKTLGEIALTKSKNIYDTLFDLLLEDPNAMMIIFEMSEEDVRTVIIHHASMVGSDGLGLLGKGKPHPRLYGTFPRILGRYVREEKILTLENAIRKMTLFPAQKLGLMDRGLIKEGMFADIVIFDSEKILDKATYECPHQFAQGVRYVLVNGQLAVKKGEYTGVLAGKILRKSSQHESSTSLK